MSRRNQEPKLYNNSVTAELYREQCLNLRIISSTATQHYTELYPGQKARIRSTIVQPILSPDNKILGTLVVHCNRESFFKEEERQFWEEALDVFSKRLALEKLKMDLLQDEYIREILGIPKLADFDF